MGNESILERVAKYHKDWVELASVFDKDWAEDIVQEMYLLLHKYNVTEQQMFTNGKPNRGYVFIIIRNIHFQLHNIRKRIDKCELNDEIYNLIDDYSEDKENEWNEFRIKAEQEVNSWEWYDKKLFTLYRDNKTSIRKLAKETGISFVSIFHTLKANKQKLKRLLQDDYDNLKL
jgi:DNA-directed RNA polymerase specialized sigma24 family protein